MPKHLHPAPDPLHPAGAAASRGLRQMVAAAAAVQRKRVQAARERGTHRGGPTSSPLSSLSSQPPPLTGPAPGQRGRPRRSTAP